MIKIGTRGSDLALAQARFVAASLASLGFQSEIVIIKTQGDKEQTLSFAKMEGKGFFTKELEDALLRRDVDLAVHSLKDLPTESPAGLCIAAIPAREDPRDCLLVRQESVDNEAAVLPLRLQSRVGSSAARRKGQLVALRPDLVPLDLRGNVPTRVRKLVDGHFDAIVLACAGLARLELDLGDLCAFPLDPGLFVPAPAQGALGLQTRADDVNTIAAVAHLNHGDVVDCIAAERGLLARFDGGCHLPFGAHCVRAADETFQLTAFLNRGERVQRLTCSGSTPSAAVDATYAKLTNHDAI